MSGARRLEMNRHHPDLSLACQCALLGISRSSLYYQPTQAKVKDLELMTLMDRQYLKTPFYGSRRMSVLAKERRIPGQPQEGEALDASDGD